MGLTVAPVLTTGRVHRTELVEQRLTFSHPALAMPYGVHVEATDVSLITADFASIEKRMMAQIVERELMGERVNLFMNTGKENVTLYESPQFVAQATPEDILENIKRMSRDVQEKGPFWNVIVFSPWIRKARVRGDTFWVPWAAQHSPYVIQEINRFSPLLRPRIRIGGPVGSRNRRRLRGRL